MSTERTTWSLSDEAAKALEAAAGRKEHESATQFIFRVAEILGESENGMDVTKCNAPESGDLLTSEEFAARMDELMAQLPPRTADELETRFR